MQVYSNKNVRFGTVVLDADNKGSVIDRVISVSVAVCGSCVVVIADDDGNGGIVVDNANSEFGVKVSTRSFASCLVILDNYIPCMFVVSNKLKLRCLRDSTPSA